MNQKEHFKSSSLNGEKKKIDDVNHSSPSNSLEVVEVENVIVAQDGAEQLDFRKLSKNDTLFEDRIAEDDEIWMVQTPVEIDADTLSSLPVDFESSVSKLKCKVNNHSKRFNVYAMSNSPASVNLLLPSKKTKSFRARTYPLTGRIILQESQSTRNKG